ncbi:MAG: hypothetical protein V3W20_13510 [Candidatus Neomarinimicrobiota bacterium]
MNNKPLFVGRYREKDITIEICSGTIPDVFRKLHFSPITNFELPDTKVNNEEFNCWLTLYRNSNAWFEQRLLEESQCN